MNENDEIIRTHWILENHVILVTAPPVLTLQRLYENDTLVLSMIEPSPAPLIHILLDARAVVTYPPLRGERDYRVLKHPRMGWSATVGVFQQPMLRFFFGVIMSAARIRHRDFKDLDSALTFLNRVDEAVAAVSLHERFDALQ